MMINSLLPAVLHREISRSLNGLNSEGQSFSKMLRSELIEREHGWDLMLELPGMDREDVELQLDGDELVVKGARTREARAETDRLLHSSRLYGSFEKRYRLTEEIDRESIEANMDKGLLRIQLKKAAQSLPRKLEIR